MNVKWAFMSHKFRAFFYKIAKNWNQKKLFYVEDFDEIKICFKSWALQNDHQSLSFVKAIIVIGKKMAKNGCKMANF